MKLPKSISPCPIREAAAEVRFESKVPADAVFGIVYKELQADFKEAAALPILSLPVEIRTKDKDLEFQPYYQLTNENSVVLIGPKAISVGMRGDYPGWEIHSKRITDTLRRVYETGIVTSVRRLGLRYISFFTFDIFPRLLLKISIGEQTLEGEETFFKTVLSSEACKTLLQIRKAVTLVKKPSERGSVIDIDSFRMEPGGEFFGVLESFLREAHRSEKELFFRLLKPEFLKELNPTYDDGN